MYEYFSVPTYCSGHMVDVSHYFMFYSMYHRCCMIYNNKNSLQSKLVRGFNLIWETGTPALRRQGPLRLHKITAATLGLALHIRSDNPSTYFWLP